MTAHIHRAAAEQVQREIREALGMPDLPVLDTMVAEGAWVIRGEQPAAGAAPKGVA